MYFIPVVTGVNHPDKLARPLAEQLEEAEATDKVFYVVINLFFKLTLDGPTLP